MILKKPFYKQRGVSMILSTAAAFYLSCAMLLPGAAEQHDPFDGADEVFRFSFESDEDLEFDEHPDDWTRRKGPAFPTYIEAKIDRTRGKRGDQSLRFKVNGGLAIMYSRPMPIDHLHSYVFQGYIRTQLLKNDAALISVSFLNDRRQRVQRFLTTPVSGTHQKWVRVRIGPIAPRQDVRFVVIGCHLVHGKKMDIRGRVWFDDLWLGRLPQLTLVSNFDVHFKQRNAEIKITSNVSGLDPGRDYQLHLHVFDSTGKLLESTTRKLKADVKLNQEKPPDGAAPKRPPEVWRLHPQDYGFYRVQSTLERDKVVILDKQTSFAVMDLVDQTRRGEFGWSISRGVETMSITELADVATQAGINWLKYPVWQSVYADDKQLPAKVGDLFEQLNRKGITPIGLLNEPPPELRKKFARDWSGIREIFTMPPAFWSDSMDKVIARYSSNVQHWQLGADTDGSFVGMGKLGETLARVKSAFDRIGRDTQIGLHWDWETPIPPRAEMPRTFLSLTSKQLPNEPYKRLSGPELIEKLKQSQRSGLPRWVLLKPLHAKNTPEQRGADLVKRMVAAKIGGAEAIFAADVFDKDYGLLNPNGSPTLLYLPWRSTALALQGAEYLGSFAMPGGSKNFAFARSGEVVLIVWNEKPLKEELYLGEKVSTMDVWGRQRTVPKLSDTNRQRIDVGPIPLIVRGCSEAVARWRMAVQFQKGKLPSQTAPQDEAILGLNTFPAGVNGQVTVNIPKDWKIDRNTWALTLGKNEKFKQPMQLTLPSNTSLGLNQLTIDFEISADRQYQFRVYRPYRIGLGDVVIRVVDRKDEKGRLVVEQIITNNTVPAEILNFRCSLFVPGHKRQKKIVTKLGGKGTDRKFYFIPDADALRGRELWLRAEQIHGRRLLNFKWVVGQNWDKKTESEE